MTGLDLLGDVGSGRRRHHESRQAENEQWLTPPNIVEALGPFDLDPCSPIDRPWPTARHHFTKADNGLAQPWFGRVWCNPPYGDGVGIWLARCAAHGNSIALIFARTDTAWFFEHIWNVANAVLFLRGRITFCSVDGRPAKTNAGAPSVLVAYGRDNADSLKVSGMDGAFVMLKHV